jgi:2-polyprenyl-6-methoxyphenol hydroxylase-like FAD-dependent oxidoreductase
MLDALVVGAGPTGLTMAAELARHGLSCRVIEQLEAPSPLSRALAIQARTMEIFEDLGIVDRVLEGAVAVQALNVVGESGLRVRVPLRDFSWLETRFPFIHMLPQDVTETLLAEHLGTLGVPVERGVKLTIFRQEPDAVEATLERVGGGIERVRARWLLGCDGARSRVRKLTSLPFEGETYDDACVLGDVRVEWSLGHGELLIMPSAHGMAAAFPMPGQDRYRLIFITPQDEASARADDVAPLSLEEFQAFADRMLPVPTRVSDPKWMSRYRLHRRGVPHYRKGRVFLAGDAAHIHSPVGGQGMNTGIQDAYNLAWKLALVTRRGLPDSLLDTYEAERLPVGHRLLESTDRGFSLMARGGALARLGRAHLVPRVAQLVLGNEWAQRRLFRFVSQLAIHYPHSALSTERQWGEETSQVRMAQGPRPGDRVPDLPVKAEGAERLHTLLRGPQHTLLLFTGLAAGARRSDLVALAARLESRYGSSLLKTYVVAAGEASPWARQISDEDGAVHRRFGAGEECFYLVRPDGYVGHRERPIVTERLEAELARRLGRQGT